MAKIVIEYDTEDRSATVTLDGKALDNVQEAGVCRENDDYGRRRDDDEAEFCLHVSLAEADDESGLRTYTRLHACASPDGARALAAGATALAAFPSFVAVRGGLAPSRLQSDIEAFIRG